MIAYYCGAASAHHLPYGYVFPYKLLRIVYLLCFLVTGEAIRAQTIHFPSSGSSINIGDLDVSGNQITVEALIYMEGNTPAGNIVSKHLNPLNVNYLLRPLTFELTTYVSGNTGPVRFLRMFNPFTLSLNKWYHIAGTYDGKRVKYYVNGCLVIDSAFSGNLYQNNYTAAIGNRSPCGCEPFLGKIDEVRIWNTARTQKEIAGNMLSLANPVAQKGLLAYYKFDGDYLNSQGNTLWTGTKTGSPVFAVANISVQAFEVTGIQTFNADCDKINNGHVTVFTNQQAAFSIDAEQYQSSNEFITVKAGSHALYAKNQEGCIIKNVVTVASSHQFVPKNLSVSLCREGSYLGHSSPGIYTDTVAASSGCDTLRTVTLIAGGRSVVSVNRTICEGSSYLGYQQAGTYSDTSVAANGCDSITIVNLNVMAEPRPDLGVSRAICKGDSINLFPGHYSSYLWQDGSANDHLKVTCAGFYSVQVANACGVKKLQLLITDGNCGIFFPTAFTPNGDGTNDLFKPAIYNLANFQWKIFNRFGQPVFESREYNKGWDGRIRGQIQDNGVYVWTCSYTTNNKTEIKKGTFLLIR